MLGRINQAYDYFEKMLPNRIDSDVFVAEPYVYSQYITSNEHSAPGRASHSWQTGSAAWMYRVSYDYILGLRPTYEGLMIDPAIPSRWDGFKAQRMFRGTRFLIEVHNPKHLEKGIPEITVDGKAIEGNIVKPNANKVCHVKVVLN